MAKLTLTDGTIFEGTTEEIFAITEKFNGTKADEPIAETLTHNGVDYTKVDRRAQVGDVVVFTKNKSSSVDNGVPYVVTTGSSGQEAVRDSYGRYSVYFPSYGRTEANTLVYEPKAEPLKVGDYVVILSSDTFHTSDYEEGEVATVTRFRYDGYVFVKSDARNEDFMHPSTVRKATDAEVAEAKASAERNAVFTQAGRKPNEYRKGDIVRVNGPLCTSHLNIGQITEVVTPTGSTNPQVRSNNGSTRYAIVEPVTFVENRLDLRK